MDNTLTGLRNRATVFAQNWQNRGNEKKRSTKLLDGTAAGRAATI